MARRIDTVEARSRLPAKDKPYWVRLLPGCGLGYRKMAAGAPGTWIARIYDSALRKDTWRTLGSFETLPAHERYAAAKKAAEALATHVERGGTADSVTVKEACTAYVKHLRAEGKKATADDAEKRNARWVDDSKIASVDLRKLQPHHLHTWRQELIAEPVVVNPYAEEKDRKTRKRSPATVNRDMNTLRAALNHALKVRHVTTDDAWRDTLKPMPAAGGRRTLYLDRKQRAELVAKAPDDLATLLRGLSLVPLRPGALADLKVSSFDKRLSTISIGKDKAGADRTIKLPPETAAFFASLTKDKLPAAPLFARADGKEWDKDSWKKPIKLAAEAAKLPAAVTAYTLRHSVITDLITAGLDVLTVARLSGTSVAMIDRHYGHLRAEHAAAALATLAL